MSTDGDSQEDNARAETRVPLPPAAVLDFLADHERLFRLNPHLAVAAWQPQVGGFHVAATNELNALAIDTVVRVEVTADGLVFRYEHGLKRATRFAVAPAGQGTRLIVTDLYPRLEDAQDPRLAEVDRSLVPWVAALHRHLKARRRWGRLPGWRWWQERLMLSLAPPQRRMVRLLVWLSAIEFALFVALVLALRLVS